MNSDEVIKDSNSQADINDNFISRELQYSSILRISLYTRLKEYTCIYMAKVHSTAGVPAIIGYIYLIVLTIDSALPNFLIDAKDLWPRDSIVTQILSIFSYIFLGSIYNVEKTRVTMSFSILIIYLIAIICLVARATIYQKLKRISSVETMSVVIVYKFILPLLIPLMMAGIPISYYTLINKREIGLNLVVAIFCPLMLIYMVRAQHQIIVPRVNFEDVPTHEWLPITATVSIINTALLTMVATFASFIEGRARIGISLYMLFESLICGLLVFKVTPTPRRNTSVLSSAISFGAAFGSLFMSFQFGLKPAKPEAFLLIFVLYFIFIYTYCLYRNKKMMADVLGFFDRCQDAGDLDTEKMMMDKEFKNAVFFWGKIRTVIEYWHPYVVTWRFFDYSLERWPNNFYIILLYGRLLSFFPNHNDKMIWISSLLAKLENTASRTSYLLQFKHISRTRQTILSVALKKEIDQLKSKVDVLMATLRRHWENILQKNVSSMWEDSEKINNMITELDSLFCQLVDDYPNNSYAIEVYLEFAKKVNHDKRKIKEIGDQLDIVKKYGKIRMDLPMTIALKIYPAISVYIGELIETSRHECYSQFLTGRIINDEDEDSYELHYAIQDTLKRTKLGQIWIGIIVVVIMTCISIGLFIFFNGAYEKLFLKKQTVSLNFITIIAKIEYEINNLRLILATYPIFKQARAPFNNIDTLMNIVAPNLYTNYHILPKWIINENTIQKHVLSSKTQFSELFKVLTELDTSNEDIEQINHILIRDEIKDGNNFNLILNQMILDAMTLANTTITTSANFYNTFEYMRFSQYFYLQLNPVKSSLKLSLDYAISDFGPSYNSLNEKMVLTVMVTLILVTLPFMLQLFKLEIQADAIADSFTLFPNTEIRRIINSLGSTASKFEDDITHVAQLSRGNSNKFVEKIKLTIAFLLSFVPMTACCLFIYYESKSFKTISETNAEIMFQLVSPFSQYVDVITLILRIYDNDQDTVSFNSSFRNVLVNFTYNTLDDACKNMNNAIWGNYSSSEKYFALGGKNVEFYSRELPLAKNVIPSYRSTFEKISTYNIPQATDLLAMYMRNMITESGQKFKPDDEVFLSLLYYFSNFSITERNQKYFSIIENAVFDSAEKFELETHVNMILAIVLQTLAALLMMLHMWKKHSIIRNALRFYYFISPDIILRNRGAMDLIDTGKRSKDETQSNFAYADTILSKINQGIVIIDRELKIIDYNLAFSETLNLTEGKNYVGIPLSKIGQEEQDRSFIELIQNIKEVLNGKHSPEFSSNIIIKTQTHRVVHFLANTTCLSDSRVAAEGDQKDIEKIAIILDDCTDTYLKIEMLEQEKNRIKSMIKNVIPLPVLNDLENGEEKISFVVQSTTIGQIRVKPTINMNYQTSEPFEFYSCVFNEFDKIISKYDLLCKARVYGNTYVYAGGLFSQINKPDKHADQSVRFAIQVLREKNELSKKFGFDIEITIGIHTGGPIIAGVMNINRPNFQIIGPVMELSEQMKATGVINQVHITRAVYELIFSSGFKVTERGETKLRRGDTLTTYLVIP